MLKLLKSNTGTTKILKKKKKMTVLQDLNTLYECVLGDKKYFVVLLGPQNFALYIGI